MTRIPVSRLIPVLLLMMLFSLSRQSRSQCIQPPSGTCSYTGLNGNCKVVIDRSFPAAPATIYARRGSTITVVVVNSSPFEQLSLDFSSAKAVVPTDNFQALLGGQSGNLQKFSVVMLDQVREAPLTPTPEDFLKATIAAISSEQSGVFTTDFNTFLTTLGPIINSSILATACDDAGAFTVAKKADRVLPEPSPWYNFEDWKKAALTKIGFDPSNPSDPTKVNLKIKNIDKEIIDATTALSKLPQDQQANLRPLLDTVTQNQLAIKARIVPNQDLILWISGLSDPTQQEFPLKDHSINRDDWSQAVWNLNATNTASVEVKRVAASPYKPAQPTDALLAPPSKNLVAAVTVQFQSASRIEFSTGIMVPARPFHSYATAAIASNGAVTGNVVQETLTYTVVPLALVNIGIKQGIVRKQPVAGFASIGTGYNPATSSVEFGVGGTFSWKSLQIGVLADIGRDQQLAGGFYVGEQFPASNPPKPLTSTQWSVKPAVSLSVRIPITSIGK